MSVDLFVVPTDGFLFLLAHLRSLLDGRRVHALLPHTVRVCQEDVIRRLPKPALGEQLAAADAHREPGMLQEDLGGSSTGLHRRPETRFQTEPLKGNSPLNYKSQDAFQKQHITNRQLFKSAAQVSLFPTATAAETHGYCST